MKRNILPYLLTLAMALCVCGAHAQSKIIRDKQRDNTSHTAVSKAPSNRRSAAAKPKTTAKNSPRPAVKQKKASRQTANSQKTEPSAPAKSEADTATVAKEKPAPRRQKAKPYFNVGKDDIRLDAAQQEVSVKIDTNCDWHISGSPLWTYTQKAKPGIVVMVHENTGTKERQGKIAVSHGTETTFIDIRQSGSPISNSLHAESNDIAMKAEKSLTHIKVWSGLDWQASSADSWIQVKKLGDELYIYASENSSGQDRHGYVKIKNNSKAEIIRIVQAAK